MNQSYQRVMYMLRCLQKKFMRHLISLLCVHCVIHPGLVGTTMASSSISSSGVSCEEETAAIAENILVDGKPTRIIKVGGGFSDPSQCQASDPKVLFLVIPGI